jgi:endonuclease YncB( thermonuclease family)
VARSNSLQLNVQLLKKALIFSAFFYVSFQAHAFDCPPQHIDEAVRVNYVYDGDTLQLEDGRKIRLMGIDTPEIFSRRGQVAADIKRQGEKARVVLQQQLGLSKQRVGLAFGPQRFDRYNRTLAHVFLPNGKNLQAWLIAQGYAIAFTTPPNDRMSSCYQQQEAHARKLKLGIWTLPQYQLKRTPQLNASSEGFHRLQGSVTRILKGHRRVTLFLDEKVEIKIHQYDLHNFNVHMLNNLAQKNIQIRGWLRSTGPTNAAQNKSRFIMTLRHPDALKVLN